MDEHTITGRRGFIGKLTAGSVAVAAAVTGQTVFAAAVKKEGFDKGTTNPADKKEKKFVPVMVTPFTSNGKIDFDGLAALVDFYLVAGVKGFFANCASSEMYALTPEERLSLARFVVRRVNGSVPVVATGSFGNAPEEKAEFAKRMYHTGINAVILITSHFATAEESDEVLISNFEQFFTLTDNIPVGTYECPTPYKRILSPKVFTYLLQSKRLVYHKDTSIDRNMVKEKLDLAKNNRLEFYDAHTPNAMYSLQWGAKGMSAIAGNFYPEIFTWMCDNATNPKKQKEVEWLQAELTKADPIISTSYPMSSKYFLHKRGVPILPISRTSPNPLTEKEKKALDNVYASFKGWCNRLGIQPA